MTGADENSQRAGLADAGVGKPVAGLPKAMALPDIQVPAGWTLAALVAGLVLGIVTGWAGGRLAWLVTAAGPVGALWLRGLQMTILPLVVSLLVVGIIQTVAAARAGVMARRTLGLFAAALAGGAIMAALVMPLLLDRLPIPAATTLEITRTASSRSGPLVVPGLGAFIESLIPTNVLAAASSGAILPTLVFFTLFALASTRLAAPQRAQVALLFEAIAGAVMVMIGWVLGLAPLGVFALSLTVAAQSGGVAIGMLAHYVMLVGSMGAMVMLSGYLVAITLGRLSLDAYARALLPVQAVALSTQSSLASLPAMLAACRRLGIADASAEFVLPLAVALFRATGPAMNLAVAIYVARLTGVALSPAMLGVGVAVACMTTLGSPSISGTVSFLSAIGPIALAMGVPVAPLALLVAVEMLPDLMRTLGNVSMDVAVAAVVNRWSRD